MISNVVLHSWHESFVNYIQGIIYQIPGNPVVSKLAKSRFQSRIDVSHFSGIRGTIIVGGNQVRGFSDNVGLVGHIFLSRRLIVSRGSAIILFILQP